MKKSTALLLLGGSSASAARALGCSRQNVHQWPEVLPRSLADRVIGARVRIEWREFIEKGRAPDRMTDLVADAIN